jgi:HlyD family secretion protein
MESAVKQIDAASVRRRKIRRRRIVTASAAVIVILAIIAFVIVSRSKNKDELTGIATATVGRATIVHKISATGTVTAQTGALVKIGSQVTGRIKALYADVDSHVKAGQVIAVLDAPDVQAQLDQSVAALNSARLALDQQMSGVGLQQSTVSSDINKAKANLGSAQAVLDQDTKTLSQQVQAAQAAINQAKATDQNAATFLSREEQLLAKGYLAAQDVDNARTQKNVAAAQLDSAQQNLQLTKTKTATALQTDRAAIDNARAVLAAAQAGSAQNVIK